MTETYNPVSGYRLSASVRQQCGELEGIKSDNKTIEFQRIHLIQDKKFFYCPVEKVASTFWRRVMYQLKASRNKQVYKSIQRRYKSRKSQINLNYFTFQHPFQVPIQSALSQFYEKFDPNTNFEDWFRFLFVRNPYERILSAYIDKVFVPNPMFWEKFGIRAIKMFRENASTTSLQCGHDATFSEFVKFVVWSETTKQKQDPHFTSISELCLPCEKNFTFVGKMENALEDFTFVLTQFGLNSSVQAMSDNFRNLAAEDAISDSINSPFGWRTNILKCMSWKEAEKRIWRKLQIRGLIGISQKLPNEHFRRASEFIKFARAARQMTNSSELKEQKKVIFQDIYSSVPIETMKKFREVFHLDFKLFGYDEGSDLIFKRETQSYSSSKYLDFRT